MSRTERDRPRSPVPALVGLGVWVVVPIALLALGAHQLDRSELVGRPRIESVPPRQPPTIDQPAGLALTWAPVQQLVAPSWQGLVTDVAVQPGGTPTNGQPLLTVDGIQRLTAVTATPFFRTLVPGATGPDVAQLNTFLAAIGLPHADTASFGAATARGVAALAARIGAPPTLTFDPAWVVFLSSMASGAAVAEVDVTVGAVAPPPGTTIAKLAPQLTAATVVSADDLTAGGQVSNPDPNAPPTGTGSTAPTALAPPPLPVPAGSSVVVANTALELTADRSHVAPSGLPQLEQTVDVGDQTTSATVRRQLGPDDWLVAPAAIRLDGSSACVTVLRGARARRVAVELESAFADVSLISAQLSRDDRLLVAGRTKLPCG